MLNMLMCVTVQTERHKMTADRFIRINSNLLYNQQIWFHYPHFTEKKAK